MTRGRVATAVSTRIVLSLAAAWFASACDGGPTSAPPPAQAELSPTPVDASGRWSPPTVFRGDPAAQGRVDAEDAIAASRPVVVRYGMPPLDLVDRETGLPYALYGCEVDDRIEAYTNAYNAAIAAARAQGRLPNPATDRR